MAERSRAIPLTGTDRLLIDGTNLLHALSRKPGRGAAGGPRSAGCGPSIPAAIGIELVFDGAPERGLRGERIAAGTDRPPRRPADRRRAAAVARRRDAGGGGCRGGRRAARRHRRPRACAASLRAKGARTAGSAWLIGRLDRPAAVGAVGRQSDGRRGRGPDDAQRQDPRRTTGLEAGARRDDEARQPAPRPTAPRVACRRDASSTRSTSSGTRSSRSTPMFVIPDWNAVIGLLPLLVFVGLVGPLLTFLPLGHPHLPGAQAAREGDASRRARRSPRSAPDGEPIFPPGLPYCRRDALIYPSGHDALRQCRGRARGDVPDVRPRPAGDHRHVHATAASSSTSSRAPGPGAPLAAGPKPGGRRGRLTGRPRNPRPRPRVTCSMTMAELSSAPLLDRRDLRRARVRGARRATRSCWPTDGARRSPVVARPASRPMRASSPAPS